MSSRFRYVNVVLNGIEPGYGKRGSSGSVFLENPIGENILNIETLKKEVSLFFETHYQKETLLYDEFIEFTDRKSIRIVQQKINY